MELREFISIRRAYNLVRQELSSTQRLTFEELAILCRLHVAGTPVKTSDIADYQGSLRPTMTHRTNHLSSLGLIGRGEGSHDRRNVVCAISEEGSRRVLELSELICARIANGQPLSRTSPQRIIRYVDAMGSVFCRAGDLVLLAMRASGSQGLAVTALVSALGLLQPTVSMSVASLVSEGLVERVPGPGGSTHASLVCLTADGRARAEALVGQIGAIVVRRKGHAAP